jgi:hypothetical protein
MFGGLGKFWKTDEKDKTQIILGRYRKTKIN